MPQEYINTIAYKRPCMGSPRVDFIGALALDFGPSETAR
jgi:hypothetical protein